MGGLGEGGGLLAVGFEPQRLADQGDDLVAHGESRLRLVAHVEAVGIQGIGKVEPFGHLDAQHFGAATLHCVDFDFEAGGHPFVECAADLLFDLGGGVQAAQLVFARPGTDVGDAASCVGKGAEIGQDGVEFASALGCRLMEALHQRRPFIAHDVQRVKRFIGWAGRAHAVKLFGAQERGQRVKSRFVQQKFAGPIADSQSFGGAGVCCQPMGVAALQAVHAPRVFRLAPVEKASGRAPGPIQVGHLQCIQVRVLGVGDLGLSAKGEIAHRHAMGAVCVCCNHQPSCLVDDSVGCQHVGRRSGLGAAGVELVGRDLHRQQNMFQLAYGGFGWKNCQNMEPKCSGKLKARKDDHLIGGLTPALQPSAFRVGQPSLRLQLGQPVQLFANGADPGDRVVVRDRHHLQPLLCSFAQPVQVAGAGFFVVVRSWGMQMQINFVPAPLVFGGWGRLCAPTIRFFFATHRFVWSPLDQSKTRWPTISGRAICRSTREDLPFYDNIK